MNDWKTSYVSSTIPGPVSKNGILIWDDKPYYSLNYYLRHRFGEKVYKIALDGGMTCPNRDGVLGTRGCIFCSAGGSGDFAAPPSHSITHQINTAIQGLQKAKSKTRKPLSVRRFIAYFQSYTNTYAPVSILRPMFLEAIRHPSVAALSIATRPDCLPMEVLDLLSELNNIKPVWVELGLQTIHETTARRIRRGYPLSTFDKAVQLLHNRNLEIVVHTILGLPGESSKQTLETMDYLASKQIQGIKLQLLHVLKGSDLAKDLDRISILTEDEYVALVLSCIEHLPPNLVIHRITGDGPKSLLLAPLWSTHKKQVMNHIHKAMKESGSYQGKEVLD